MPEQIADSPILTKVIPRPLGVRGFFSIHLWYFYVKIRKYHFISIVLLDDSVEIYYRASRS